MTRECGDCRVCCTIGGVPEINKPAHSKCPHDCAHGCDIHGKPERPKVCIGFECAWRRGEGDEGDRPDKIGIMYTINFETIVVGGVEKSVPIIFAVETKERALETSGRGMAVKMIRRLKLPIIVVGVDEKPPNDYGKHIVIHDVMKQSTNRMRGEMVRPLAHDVTKYELVHGCRTSIP